MSASVLLAGCSRVDITPSVGVPLIGYSPRTAVGIHDHLFSRALAFEKDGKRWIICSNDLCRIAQDMIADIKGRVSKATGLSPEELFIANIHTHSGPAWDADGWRNKALPVLIAENMTQALATMQPVSLRVGRDTLREISINRRHPGGVIDPELQVLCVEGVGGRLMAVCFNFSCHSVVLGASNRLISGDLGGLTSQFLERTLGEGVVAAFVHGAAANINPLTQRMRARWFRGEDFNVYDRDEGTFEECEALAWTLGRRVLEVMKEAEPLEAGDLWAELEKVSVFAESEGTVDIQALGLGSFAVVGAPGELFVQTGFAIKEGLRAMGYDHVFVSTYANGGPGPFYIAMAEAFEEGGYEVAMARRAGISRQAADRVIDAALRMAQRHKPSP